MIYVAYIPRTRLGNWLFQIGAALTTGQEVAFWCQGSEEAKRYIEARIKPLLPNLKLVLDVPPGTPVWKQQKEFTPLPPELREGDWIIEGLFQSLRYLEADDVSAMHGGGRVAIA